LPLNHVTRQKHPSQSLIVAEARHLIGIIADIAVREPAPDLGHKPTLVRFFEENRLFRFDIMRYSDAP
jgi:hypothetical protein